MTPYVIVGAGAVGSSIGAYLSRGGHRVVLVSRKNHAEAIQRQGGVRVVTYTETFLAQVEAGTSMPTELPEAAVILITVQSPDVVTALDAAGSALADHAVVTFQNGIRAEEVAAERCPRLYGGIVRFTATLLDPGEVRLRTPGQLIVGRYPSGEDGTTRSLVEDFRLAGFQSGGSPDIRVEKVLKLMVNLVSGPAVLLHRTEVVPALAHVQVALLEEARNVFAAAGIQAAPLSGLGQSVDEMIARFRTGGSPPDGKAVYNSTWQNLHHKRARLENSFYHGEVIQLGEAHGIPTPVNRRALDLLEHVRKAGLGPEPWTPAEFSDRFRDVVNVEAPLSAASADSNRLDI